MQPGRDVAFERANVSGDILINEQPPVIPLAGVQEVHVDVGDLVARHCPLRLARGPGLNGKRFQINVVHLAARCELHQPVASPQGQEQIDAGVQTAGFHGCIQDRTGATAKRCGRLPYGLWPREGGNIAALWIETAGCVLHGMTVAALVPGRGVLERWLVP